MFLDEPTERQFNFAKADDGATGHWLKDLVTLPFDLANPEKRKAVSETFNAHEQQTRLVDSSNSRRIAQLQVFDTMIEQVQKNTGVKLENPLVGAPMADYSNYDPHLDYKEEWENINRQASEKVDGFIEQITALKQAHPDKLGKLDLNTAFERQAQQLAFNADKSVEKNDNRDEMNNFMWLGGMLGGAVWGARYDPITYASLLVNPSGGAGKTALTRIASGAFKAGAINAAATVPVQFAVQDWRDEAALEHGFKQGALNVLAAGALGAGIGGAAQGVKEVAPSLRRALKNVYDGKATASETLDVSLKLNPDLSEGDISFLKGMAEKEKFNAALEGGDATFKSPLVQEKIEQHIDYLQSKKAPLPEPILDLPPPPNEPNLMRLMSEEISPRDEALKIFGKPVHFEGVDAASLKADAATFQYKGGGDATGVSERLRDVRQWDATASGKAFFFEGKDGQRFIADGHQRLGLASRLLNEKLEDKINIDGYVFKEADGWLPREVRVLAAKKNIQEGSGSAIDTARILKEMPELLDSTVGQSSQTIKTGVWLSKLDDEALGFVVNGIVPERQAAFVAQATNNPQEQMAIMKVLAELKPETERQAGILVRDVLQSGFAKEEQFDMFGSRLMASALYEERMKVLDDVLRELASDKKIFGLLNREAAKIESAGNVLNEAVNNQSAMTAGQVRELIERLAQSKSPVSDMLNDYALAVQQGMKVKEASRQFIDKFTKDFEENGLAFLNKEEPRLKPFEAGEPSSKQLARKADEVMPNEEQTLSLFDEPTPQTSPLETLPKLAKDTPVEVIASDLARACKAI
jgi:hypothetical protein